MISVKISGIDTVINHLNSYKNNLQRKANEIARRLADYGLMLAQAGFDSGVYDGMADNNVSVEATENGYKIVAQGNTVLFFEFGAGITYGYGHPQAAEFGMGPGTYPTKSDPPNWNNPDGWIIPKEHGGGHTYGNPPYMPMFKTKEDLEREVERVAREVFSD